MVREDSGFCLVCGLVRDKEYEGGGIRAVLGQPVYNGIDTKSGLSGTASSEDKPYGHVKRSLKVSVPGKIFTIVRRIFQTLSDLNAGLTFGNWERCF